jgi:hypothetical protein
MLCLAVRTGARLGEMLVHVTLCLTVRYKSSVGQVAGPRHVVFDCAVRELG